MLPRGDGPGPGETPAGNPILMYLKLKSVAIRNQRNSTNFLRRHNSERRPMMYNNRRLHYNYDYSTCCPPVIQVESLRSRSPVVFLPSGM